MRLGAGSLAILVVLSSSSLPLLAASVTRGPYLQLGTSDSIVVRWRTDVSTSSRVNYGTTQGALDQQVESTRGTTEHEIFLSGLLPDTRYYYSVGSSTDVLAGDDANHFFDVAPPVGTPKSTRIWVLGDSANRPHHIPFCGGAGSVVDVATSAADCGLPLSFDLPAGLNHLALRASRGVFSWKSQSLRNLERPVMGSEGGGMFLAPSIAIEDRIT